MSERPPLRLADLTGPQRALVMALLAQRREPPAPAADRKLEPPAPERRP